MAFNAFTEFTKQDTSTDYYSDEEFRELYAEQFELTEPRPNRITLAHSPLPSQPSPLSSSKFSDDDLPKISGKFLRVSFGDTPSEPEDLSVESLLICVPKPIRKSQSESIPMDDKSRDQSPVDSIDLASKDSSREVSPFAPQETVSESRHISPVEPTAKLLSSTSDPQELPSELGLKRFDTDDNENLKIPNIATDRSFLAATSRIWASHQRFPAIQHDTLSQPSPSITSFQK